MTTEENARQQVAIGFGSFSDRSRQWREYFIPITKCKTIANEDYFRHSSENRPKELKTSIIVNVRLRQATFLHSTPSFIPRNDLNVL